MKISTLIDTNIFIDLLGNGPQANASSQATIAALDAGDIVLSAIVWAELAFSKQIEKDLMRRIAWLKPRREGFPFEAAFPAGRAHSHYRLLGGRRERTLPDFLIGAHALIGGHRLLTRDASRYHSYFPDLDILSPETLP